MDIPLAHIDLSVHAIDRDILLSMSGINAGHPARANLRQPLQLSRGHIPHVKKKCQDSRVALGKYASGSM